MEKQGAFTIRTNRVDGTNYFSAIIDFGQGRIIAVKGTFKTSRTAFEQALIDAGKILDAAMRTKYPSGG